MAIRSKQYEILYFRMAAFLWTIHFVVECCLPGDRHFQTHSKRLARCGTTICFFKWQVPIRIRALVDAFGGLRAGAFLIFLLDCRIITLFFWSEVAISLAFVYEPVSSFAVFW